VRGTEGGREERRDGKEGKGPNSKGDGKKGREGKRQGR